VGAPQLSCLEAAFEHVDDAVLVIEPENGHVVYVNKAFSRDSGYEPRESLGQCIDDLLRPRSLADEPGVWVMARANGDEYFVRRKREALDPKAADSFIIEVQRDITADRTLRESEALYRKLAERSSDIVSRTDASGRCIYISPSCREVLGYEPQELVGRHALVDLAHPDDVAKQRQVLAGFVQRGVTSGSPLRRRLRRKDGTYAWLEILTHIERDSAGQIVEVQSWARDVSARVEVEQALVESEASFRSLLERMPDAVLLHRDGVILYANSEMSRLAGQEQAEGLVGRSILDIIHPDERDFVRDRLRDAGRSGARSREHRLLSRDGSERILEVTALPVVFEGDVAFVAICHDVTDRRRMEERLAVAERMALVGRLASGVGHEINNPLAYMLGNLDLARAELAELTGRPPTSDCVERIDRRIVTVREGAERVRDIVRDLKSLYTKSDERMKAVDLARALDAAAATADHEIRLRARLVKEYGAVQRAWASEGRLTQVFVNLLVNAAQAIPDGHANDNEILVRTRDEGARVIVEVRDTGVGIAAEDLPRIFEPFFTTKPTGVGAGLGLSISHAIVTAYGGTLMAERLSPRGALLRVELPASGEVGAPASPLGSRVSEAQRARLLIVDDEPRMARVIGELLSPHEVMLVHSGREAIAHLAKDTSFDAVVCDLQMNDGNGVDVYDYLRERAPDLARRTIFTTGGAFTARAREFLDRCPQPVLEKPFEAARLAMLVNEMACRAAGDPGTGR
jgi:two-component system, cell cycle sensor histidine kinase and response regulator CckA